MAAGILLLWLVKRVFFRRLKRWASKTPFSWDNILVDSLGLPLNLLLAAAIFIGLSNVLPLPDNPRRVLTAISQAGLILALIFFLDGLVMRILKLKISAGITHAVPHGVLKALFRGFIASVGVLLFLDLLGISITPILASLGIGSIALALALQDTLSNLFAGLYVAIDRPVSVGDYVKVGTEVEGYVTEVGWRSTHITTLPGNEVILPNTKIADSVITNFYFPKKDLAVLIEMGVHYESDLPKVEKVVEEVGSEVMRGAFGGVTDFAPFVRFHTFAESSVNFTVILRAKEFTGQYTVKHEFIKKIHARFKKEGIVIPYPIRTLELSAGAVKALKN